MNKGAEIVRKDAQTNKIIKGSIEEIKSMQLKDPSYHPDVHIPTEDWIKLMNKGGKR